MKLFVIGLFLLLGAILAIIFLWIIIKASFTMLEKFVESELSEDNEYPENVGGIDD